MNKQSTTTANSQNGTGSGNPSFSSTTANSCANNNPKCDCCKCTYCQNSLGSVSVKCSECFNFNLCLKCFSMSAEIGEHRKDHGYSLKSTINYPIFGNDKPWSYKEELLLIQFIEQYGFDNWEEIAKHISPRTPEECMQHYHSYYIYGNLGKNTFNSNNIKLNNSETHNDTLSLISSSSSTTSTTTSAIKREISSSQLTTVLLPPIEMSIEEQRALGYMPFRDDFEREYKNNAETLLSNLTIANNQISLLSSLISSNKETSSSTSVTVSSTAAAASSASSLSQQVAYDYEDVIDLDLKLTLIQMYRECLMERQRFKKIARDYGLLSNASSLINKINNNGAPTNSSLSNLNTLCSTNGNGSTGITACSSNSAKLNGFNDLFRKNRRRGRRSFKEKEIIELNEKLKKYAQFMSVAEFETLLENMRKQRQLSKRIQELNYFRSEMGMSTFNEIEKYLEGKNGTSSQNISLNGSNIAKRRKRRKKMSESMLADDSTPKRLTRRQYSTSMFTPVNSFATLSLGLTARKYKKRIKNINNNSSDNNKTDNNDTTINGDLDVSNVRNFSQSRSNSSESSDSMNNYELVNENYGHFDEDSKNDLISEDRDEDDEDEDVDVDNNDENTTFDLINQLKKKQTQNEDLFTDEDDDDDNDKERPTEDDEDDENEDDDDDDEDDEDDEEEDDEEENENNNDEDCSEDLSSGGAASSGGSGINDSNHELLCSNGRRLRQLSNRRNNLINDSFNLKQNGTKDLKYFDAKQKKHKSCKSMSKLKKKRLNKKRINGRSERLCSMPGYNLLSENEKKLISSLHMKPNDYVRYKTNLIKNNLINRKNQYMSNSSVLSNQSYNNNINNNNEIQSQNETASMMLRRHSNNETINQNSNDENNVNSNNCSNINNKSESSSATTLDTTSLNTTPKNANANAISNSYSNPVNYVSNTAISNKNLTSLMKSTCPDYFLIPRTTRKRILRFLCDNGWIDIS